MKIAILLILVLLCAIATMMLNVHVLERQQQQQPKGTASTLKNFKKSGGVHEIAGLSCERYGGPSDEIAAEMIYWRDIPSDAEYTSPYANVGPKTKYLTFEPDEGNWNNKRLSMETAVVMAVVMGRTLVLPPQQELIYSEIFHFASLAKEFPGKKHEYYTLSCA